MRAAIESVDAAAIVRLEAGDLRQS